jgi:hypothetical protein
MGNPFDDRDLPVDPKLLLDPQLEPGESILWTGRPDPAALSRQSLPRSLAGLGFTAFTLLWICMVVRGGSNNWDRGRVVAPFARHNVIIAAVAGLWFLPFCAFMLTAPLRARWRAGRTCYVLTDLRAVIIEPRLLTDHSVRTFPPEALALTQCKERPDGSGDLVFRNQKTRFGMPEPVGFLAVESVREVENLVRTVQSSETRPRPLVPGRNRSDGESAFLGANTAATFKLPMTLRVFLGFFVVVFSLLALFEVVGGIVVGVLLLAVGPPHGVVPGGLSATNLGTIIGGGLFMLIWLGGVFVFVRWALGTPVEIAVGHDGELIFRGTLRSRSINTAAIISIKTGGWRDPNRLLAVIRHQDGKFILVNHFPGFREFLAAVKALNPKVDVEGF